MNIDPAWTPEGLEAARRLGLAPADVIDVMYAPNSIQFIGPDTVWFIGEAIGAIGVAIIAIITDRQSRATSIFEITHVRLADNDETEKWRSKQS